MAVDFWSPLATMRWLGHGQLGHGVALGTRNGEQKRDELVQKRSGVPVGEHQAFVHARGQRHSSHLPRHAPPVLGRLDTIGQTDQAQHKPARREATLQRQIDKVKRDLAALGDLRPGSLSTQYNVCGSPAEGKARASRNAWTGGHLGHDAGTDDTLQGCPSSAHLISDHDGRHPTGARTLKSIFCSVGNRHLY